MMGAVVQNSPGTDLVLGNVAVVVKKVITAAVVKLIAQAEVMAEKQEISAAMFGNLPVV